MDPQIVKEFNRLRIQYIQSNHGLTKFKLLQDTDTTMVKEEWEQRIEELDQIRIESMQFADKFCRKLKMGDVPWSPEIQKVMNRISYLQRCRLRYINKLLINSRTLHKSFERTDYTTPFTKPEDIILQLKTEFKQYNSLKKQASSMRIQFLESLAQAKANESGQKKEKIYQQLLLHESVRHMFRKIKYAIRDPRTGVTSVQAESETGHWKTITEKEAIEKECMIENHKRFTQAKDSPPMLPDQIQLLGWKAESQTASKILNGEDFSQVGIHPEILKTIKI